MQKTTNIEVTAKALTFLNDIKGSASVTDFIQLEFTGDQIADKLLSQVSLMMLQHLRTME